MLRRTRRGEAACVRWRTWVVSQAHERACDDSPGTEAAPLRTISAAAAKARAGDTVLVHAGVYRERVAPARGGRQGAPIVYQAAAGETVVLKGSDVWRPDWRAARGRRGVCFGRFAKGMFGDYNPYRIEAAARGMARTLGQLFVDGEPLLEVGTLDELHAVPGSWMAGDGPERGAPGAHGSGDPQLAVGLWVHFGPSDVPLGRRPVELTVRQRVFAPHRCGLRHIHVRGFVTEHAANQFPSGFWASRETAQCGLLGTRSGHHWVIEGNVIRHAKGIGLDCGSESRFDLEGEQPMPRRVGEGRVGEFRPGIPEGRSRRL